MIAQLRAWLLSRSKRIEGDEPYGNSYVFVILRALDLNVASLVWRHYGITISAWTGLELRKSNPATWAILLGVFLDVCQRNHCEEAIAADRERARLAIHILDYPYF